MTNSPPNTAAPACSLSSGRAASLSVRNGQLVAFENGRELTFMPATQRFETIFLDSFGAHLTADALTWLHRQNITLIVTCDGEPVALSTCLPLTNVELRRRQYAYLSNPLPIARHIVAQKIATGHDHGRLTPSQAHAFAAQALTAPDRMALHLIEARTALVYFERFNAELNFRHKKPNWPESWATYPGRISPIGGPSPRRAIHPVNAMLNLAYTVAANQLTRTLVAHGLDAAAGFLHRPEDHRASLAYDALELLRADIDTRILSFIAARVWHRADFTVTPSGAVRLLPDLARVVASRALATKADTARVAAWMIAQIMRA